MTFEEVYDSIVEQAVEMRARGEKEPDFLILRRNEWRALLEGFGVDVTYDPSRILSFSGLSLKCANI